MFDLAVDCVKLGLVGSAGAALFIFIFKILTGGY